MLRKGATQFSPGRVSARAERQLHTVTLTSLRSSPKASRNSTSPKSGCGVLMMRGLLGTSQLSGAELWVLLEPF